jgi:serine phosphatase RsbU (regulator of sigma subunit)
MQSLPPIVANRVQALTVEDRAVAYLQIDTAFRVLDAGGNLANYGLDALRAGQPVFEHAYFLEGLLPLVETPYFVPSVELARGHAADVHMHREADETWVVLLDVTAERNATQRLQQKAYEMTLLEEKQAQLNRALEATNTELLATQRELKISRDAVRDELRRKQLELAEARSLQLSLVPQAYSSQAQGCLVSIHCVMEPAKEVGGDLADHFTVDDDLVVLVLGDVSGKGAGAALMMARTHASFRGLCGRTDAAELFRNPERAVALVNAELARGNVDCTFVTLLLAVFDKQLHTLTYVRAGHVPPLLRRGPGIITELDEQGGLPLGLMEGARYKPTSIRMKPGDGLLVVTDGITEAATPSGELFGDERLAAFLTANTTGGKVLLDELFAEVESFEQYCPAADDKAVVLLEIRDVR